MLIYLDSLTLFSGHGNRCYDGQLAGCAELLRTIQKRVQPKYHLFGHIHEGNEFVVLGKSINEKVGQKLKLPLCV